MYLLPGVSIKRKKCGGVEARILYGFGSTKDIGRRGNETGNRNINILLSQYSFHFKYGVSYDLTVYVTTYV